eukprot:23831_1
MPYFNVVACCIPFGCGECLRYCGAQTREDLLDDKVYAKEFISCARIRFKDDEPKLERWKIKANGDHVVCEIRLEHQRFAPIMGAWTAPFMFRDPWHLTDSIGKQQWNESEIPSGWKWIRDWEPLIDTNLTDEEGWTYSKNFVGWGKWRADEQCCDVVRRRHESRVRLKPGGIRPSQYIVEGSGTEISAPGNTILAMIQHGIEIALLHDRVPDDAESRVYFNLKREDGLPYQFQDYSAYTFGKIRELYGISEFDYKESMCSVPFIGGEVESSGKSGEIFWRSDCGNFVIKTISQNEAYLLQKILKKYLGYTQGNKHTLVSRYFGLYKLRYEGIRMRFIVMNNVMCTKNHDIQFIYDLKGTTEDRLVEHDSKTDSPVLKDLNFQDRYMLVSEKMMNALHEQIEKDANFLLSVDVMDYSLLLGVSISNEPVEKAPEECTDLNADLQRVESCIAMKSIFEHGVRGQLNETYFVGIIDLLQDWTNKKVLANAYKTARFADFRQSKIDSVPPKTYAPRFIEYFKRNIRSTTSLSRRGSLSENSRCDYRLTILVIKAQDLPAKDLFGRMRSSLSDPFVRIEFGEDISASSVVRANVNPVWNHMCSFSGHKSNAPKRIKFHVWDYDWALKPDFIGVASLDVATLFDKTPENIWLDLHSDSPLDSPSKDQPSKSKSKAVSEEKEEEVEEKSASEPCGRIEVRCQMTTISSESAKHLVRRSTVTGSDVRVSTVPQASGATSLLPMEEIKELAQEISLSESVEPEIESDHDSSHSENEVEKSDETANHSAVEAKTVSEDTGHDVDEVKES